MIHAALVPYAIIGAATWVIARFLSPSATASDTAPRLSGVSLAGAHYRGQHRAPGRADGAPLYDVSLNGIYPSDFYTSPISWYSDGSRGYARAHGIAHEFRGRPNRLIKIYRALPKDISGTGRTLISPGDWVTISRSYAKDHGESALRGEYKIVSKEVHAADIYTEGNSLSEWGYDPMDPHELTLLDANYRIERLERLLKLDPTNEKVLRALRRWKNTARMAQSVLDARGKQ